MDKRRVSCDQRDRCSIVRASFRSGLRAKGVASREFPRVYETFDPLIRKQDADRGVVNEPPLPSCPPLMPLDSLDCRRPDSRGRTRGNCWPCVARSTDAATTKANTSRVSVTFMSRYMGGETWMFWDWFWLVYQSGGKGQRVRRIGCFFILGNLLLREATIVLLKFQGRFVISM